MTAPSIYSEIHQAANAEMGIRLFTVMVLDHTNKQAQRVYTSHPDDYPVTGSKPMLANRWSRHVLDEQKPFVANRTEDFADVFGDHAVINALGCESVVNVPVIDRQQVVGTVNFLDRVKHFSPGRVAQLIALVERHTAELVEAMQEPVALP